MPACEMVRGGHPTGCVPRCLFRFAETTAFDVLVRTPLGRIDALFHEAVECREWPIYDALHQPVLDRIEMDVIQMAPKILFVTDLMLPESTLPDCCLVAPSARDTRTRVSKMGAYPFGKGSFDQPPSFREVAITRGQGPDAVQMIG